MPQQNIILIMGPTASGKSALALQIALEKNGSIINADAMQIYAGLPILTAQPSTKDRTEIPHFLYETVDAADKRSVAKWLGDAVAAIRHVQAQNRMPIIVGGTGMYIEALMEGIAEIPEIPPEVHDKAQSLYASLGEATFREILGRRDPETAHRLAPNDRQRLIRAFEVSEHTGKPISEWQKNTKRSPLAESGVETLAEIHVLMPPREKLYEACDTRFAKMIERGAIDEVKALVGRQLSPSLPAMKILGVREIAAFLGSEMSREEMIAKAQQMTRNYAKRQTTWFRNRMIGHYDAAPESMQDHFVTWQRIS